MYLIYPTKDETYPTNKPTLVQLKLLLLKHNTREIWFLVLEYGQIRTAGRILRPPGCLLNHFTLTFCTNYCFFQNRKGKSKILYLLLTQIEVFIWGHLWRWWWSVVGFFSFAKGKKIKWWVLGGQKVSRNVKGGVQDRSKNQTKVLTLPHSAVILRKRSSTSTQL